MDRPLPPLRAFLYFVLSTLLISGGGYVAVKRLFNKSSFSERPLSNNITTIIQTGPRREALKTSYLAELLNLSQNEPTSSIEFNVKKAEEKLLRSPVIKTAEVALKDSETLYIAYTVREPIFRLYDVENSALDEEGFLFPLSPFFTPKTIPQLYLGLPPVQNLHWNVKISHPQFDIAKKLLSLLTAPPYRDLFLVKRIDISKGFDSSLGRREIVLIIEEKFKKGSTLVFLRLTPKNVSQELANYLELRKQLAEGDEAKREIVVDLRIPQLGFVK